MRGIGSDGSLGRVDINLARHPSLSFKPYFLLAGLLGVVGAAVLVLEVWGLSSAWDKRRTAAREIASLEERQERDLAGYRALEPYVDTKRLKKVAEEASAVAGFVERRVFDWNELFVELESVVPNDVLLTEISPRIGKGGFTLTLSGRARTLEQQNEFVDRLQGSSKFEQAFVVNQSLARGEVEFTIESGYRPAARVVAEKSS